MSLLTANTRPFRASLFEGVLRWARRRFPVRRRHIFTRRDRLRLRYIVLPLLPLVVTLLFLPMATVVSKSAVVRHTTAQPSIEADGMALVDGAVVADISPAAGAETADDVFERYVNRTRRMNRYLDHAALSESTQTPPGTVKIRQAHEEQFTFGKGDTVTGVLLKAGLTNAEAFIAARALEKQFDPRDIKPGQKAILRYLPEKQDGRFVFSALDIEIDPLRSVSLSQSGEDFSVAIKEREAQTRLYAQEAEIKVSLYGSAEQAGIPVSVIAEAIRIYSWDIDFQRDIRQGDHLKLMYERLETHDGIPVKNGEILFAELSVNGHKIPLYRFEDKDGIVDYYTPEGASVRKTLMKTPIDGARLSSGFGMRKHPVLGYSKMHKGTDFAAPTGTPIYAAGDGVIEKAGPNSSYGNYIRIRHNATLKTAYAHMSRFAKGISVGKRVRQGSVIGYVGTTGRSTGPHLHYEILVNGEQKNSQTIKMQQGESLKGERLAAFKRQMEETDRRYAELKQDMQYASLQEEN